ncbi:MAG: aminodeoxychorismate/anthranilate synthase component II [Planctomycetales bacterium]|nr:aminodeoxychorismate/anthranilate synthase component II [Planctomycetales bacterium]
MILLIDNYDSFVYNLRRYLVRLGQQVRVVRNDHPALRQTLGNPAERGLLDGVRAVLISPGPKRPGDAPYVLEFVRRFSGELPLLGICLGHQIIFEALGGRVIRAAQPRHGCSSQIQLQSSPLFRGLGEQAEFARYHSLVADPQSCPDTLQMVAWSEEGQVMAVQHKSHPTYGVQFHPESILSQAGYQLLNNFLRLAKLPTVDLLPASDLLHPGQRLPLHSLVDAPWPPECHDAVPLPVRRSK